MRRTAGGAPGRRQLVLHRAGRQPSVSSRDERDAPLAGRGGRASGRLAVDWAAVLREYVLWRPARWRPRAEADVHEGGQDLLRVGTARGGSRVARPRSVRRLVRHSGKPIISGASSLAKNEHEDRTIFSLVMNDLFEGK